MSNFLATLGNIGSAIGQGTNQYDAILQRKQQASAAAQRMQQIDQQMKMTQQQFDMNQAALLRDRNAATAAMQSIMGPQGGQPAMPGVPQSVPMPGATPIPGAQQGGPQMPMGGPQPAPMPQRPMPPMVPQGQPGAGMPPQGAAPGGAPAAGGGITISQFVDNLKTQNPNMDPLTMFEALQKATPLLKSQDQELIKNAQLQIAQQRADDAERMREWERDHKTDGSEKTESRELHAQALRVGVDPTGKTDAQVSKEVAAKTGQTFTDLSAKRNKLSTQETRYNRATDDVKSITENIDKIIADNPKSVGAYGKLYKGIGAAYGLLEKPEPADAEAANKLNVEFEKLDQALGTAGSYGGMGASTLTNRWDRVLGDHSVFTNPQRVRDQLRAINSDLDKYKVKPGETSDGDAPIDDLLSKYLSPPAGQ